MKTIEYKANGRKAYLDLDSVFVHEASGRRYVRQGNNKLRELSPDEIAAVNKALRITPPSSEPNSQEMPDLSGMTKKQIDDAAASYGIKLDGRKNVAGMLDDFAAAWAEKRDA